MRRKYVSSRSEYNATCRAVERRALASGWKASCAHNGPGYWKALHAWADAKGLAYPTLRAKKATPKPAAKKARRRALAKK